MTRGVMIADSDRHDEPEEDDPHCPHLDSDPDAGGGGGLGV